MCELLIRVRERIGSAVLPLGARVLQAGDVVLVCENRWSWSRMERVQPFWRIVRVPDMEVSEAVMLLMQEGDRHSRARALDFRAEWLPQEVRDWFEDDSRAKSIYPLSGDVVRRMAMLKVGLQESSVIG